MPPLLTTLATVLCAHGGQVTLRPGQSVVLAAGAPVLCVPDLVGAAIVGCPVPATTTSKPCTTVVSTLPGSESAKVLVGGKPAYLVTASGMTDGLPPAPITVVSPGQTNVHG